MMARALRLPPAPAAPAGVEGPTLVFHPSPPYYRLRLLRWAVAQIASAIGLFLAFGWRWFPSLGRVLESVQLGFVNLADLMASRVVQALEIWGVAVFVLQLPLTLLAVRLDYVMRWYLVTDRSLRIREGLRTVRERTMTFANIQNLSIRQGPVQRLLGIADLRVCTAGGGGGQDTNSGSEDSTDGDKSLHVAVFRGIDNAEEIRDLILGHLREARTSGIGDPEETLPEPPPAQPPGGRGLEAAVTALRLEAERLREALADRQP
jgi:membrane protein YdbS with pleckstrin-like domain